jgi:hypothetical protein
MLAQDPVAVEPAPDAFLAKAQRWGQQDVLASIELRGSQYFVIGGDAWKAYNDGYAVGLQRRKVAAGCPLGAEEMSELEFLDYVLATLRTGAEPVTRLTEEQLAELEAERPGEDFSHYPFLY